MATTPASGGTAASPFEEWPKDVVVAQDHRDTDGLTWPDNTVVSENSKDPSELIGQGQAGDQRSHRGMREIITVWLLGLLCAVVALAFIAIFVDEDVPQLDRRFVHLKNLLDVVLGPVVTLLSSVIGFYFGSQAAQQQQRGGSGR